MIHPRRIHTKPLSSAALLSPAYNCIRPMIHDLNLERRVCPNACTTQSAQ